tara:strand:- start:1076 stop:1456 length:381 start_codon:yes stop_codon:yes gene_type:complete
MNNNPLSPHIQIYNWHISSLVSISHRITGVINILAMCVICFWIWTLTLGNTNYDIIYNFFNSFLGKFFVISFIWSYSFQILCEIRHWFWDLGYGFELKTSKITGFLVILGSISLTIIFYTFKGILI